MTLMKRGLVAGLVLAVLGGFANAQKLTVNPDPLVAGGTATIEYSDANRPGDTIVVTIDGPGFPEPTTVEVAIQLNDQGTGSTTWLVPNWPWALFNAPGVREVPRWITSGVDATDG